MAFGHRARPRGRTSGLPLPFVRLRQFGQKRRSLSAAHGIFGKSRELTEPHAIHCAVPARWLVPLCRRSVDCRVAKCVGMVHALRGAARSPCERDAHLSRTSVAYRRPSRLLLWRSERHHKNMVSSEPIIQRASRCITRSRSARDDPASRGARYADKPSVVHSGRRRGHP